jgi:hypothetical protein
MTRADNPMIDGRGTRPSRVGSPAAYEAGWAGQRCAGRLERPPSRRRESSAMPRRSVRPGNAPATLRQPSLRTLEPAGHEPSQLRRGPAGRRSGSKQQHLGQAVCDGAPHTCLTSSAFIGCGGSQGVAAVLGVPADGVAIGSQFGEPTPVSTPVTGPLTSEFGGAPRGIRTPNRQIRSLVLYPLS